jgi:hypothetical protein
MVGRFFVVFGRFFHKNIWSPCKQVCTEAGSLGVVRSKMFDRTITFCLRKTWFSCRTRVVQHRATKVRIRLIHRNRMSYARRSMFKNGRIFSPDFQPILSSKERFCWAQKKCSNLDNYLVWGEDQQTFYKVFFAQNVCMTSANIHYSSIRFLCSQHSSWQNSFQSRTSATTQHGENNISCDRHISDSRNIRG